MKKLIIFSILIATILVSCQNLFNRHLIDSKVQREEVSSRFNERIKLIQDQDSAINGIINRELTNKEREGFEFLYAYMPLSDIAMHSSNYVLSQTGYALHAKSFFKWGKKIPSDIFLHFVLPYRVNNEYTDTARQVFFNELKNRIKDMSMYDAALEVNHWCHEKVTYRSTDERTSGPLTTVRTAFGRCGEESTFTVSAMRSVCIPARQVYTPRWAHTDDNHAWVEVWIDGKWYFLGACEPEPELNMGWFAGPAKRAMMTRTFVFGKYNGPEEKLSESDWYTEINLLPNYAPTKNLAVKVLNVNGIPEANAKVEYQLYNYAEFYSIATRKTNQQGVCNVTTGFGDLMIWASKDSMYGFTQADRMLTDTLTITIKSTSNFENIDITLIPPDVLPISEVDQQKTDANNSRIKEEDIIRNNYIATFIDSATSVNLAMEKGVNIDETWKYLSTSRGNWQEIYNFIKQLDGKDLTVGMALLNNIAEKDFHDISASTLQNHVSTVDSFPSLLESQNFEYFDKYILSPRIGREFITPWRGFLQNEFSFDQIGYFRNDPYQIAKWIESNITIDKESNYYKVPLSPESIYKLKIADPYSRDIFFVAICRSFGIPARLEPATKRPQFLIKGTWHDVLFDQPVKQEIAKGSLTLTANANEHVVNPQYYTNFTIGKLENGKFVTLDFENDQNLKKFPAKITLDAGIYRLITGNRLNDGTVLCRIKYFDVNTSKETSVNIDFNEVKTENQVLGKINTDITIPDINSQENINLGELTEDRDLVLAIIDPNKEPTKHLMNDISAVKTELNDYNVVFAIGHDKLNKDFSASMFANLPTKTFFAFDKDQIIAKAIAEGCNKTISTNYPVVTVISRNSEVIFYSEGYSIGLGNQIVKVLKH